MNDLISRQDAIDALAKAMPSLTTPDGCGEFDHEIQIAQEAFVDAMQIIHELPSAQPEPKRDEWERHYYKDGNPDGWQCDKCKEWYYFGQTLPNFCPNCGAKMDVKDGDKQ